MSDFYCRYYVGHTGRYGHEFLEFELKADGSLRYANDSRYRNDSLLKKQACVSPAVVQEVQRVIRSSKILECDDEKWPHPDRAGRQELEVLLDGQHISFTTNAAKLNNDILTSQDPEGLSRLFYVVSDLKSLVLALISMHHRIKPV